MLQVVTRNIRNIVLTALVLAPSAYLAWTWRAMPQLGMSHDDAVYLVSAKSLAEGNGYRIESLPGQPFQTKYPPMLSILLAAVWKLSPSFPENLKLATLIAWLMLLPYLFLIRALFRSFDLGPMEVWLLTAVALTNPIVSFLGTTMMSDLPFLSLFLASILLAEKALDPDKTAWLALGAGLVAGLAFLTRTVAFPVALTGPLCFLYRRQLRRGLLFLGGMLPAIGTWQFWTSMHRLPTSDTALTYYTGYLDWQRATVQLDNLARVMWINLDVMWRSLGQLLVFDTAVAENRHFERIVAAGALVGALRLIKHSRRIQYPAAAAGMAAILLAYHYPPESRLCLPLFPLILMGLWTEVKRFWRTVRAAWQDHGVASRVAAVAAAGVLGVATVFLIAAYVVGNAVLLPDLYTRSRSKLAARQAGYEWLRTNTPPDATFYAYDDPVLYLYTGRRCLGLTMPYARAYHSDPEREANEFVLAVPRQAREHRLNYLFLTTTDFYREGQQRARVALDAAARDPGFRKEYQSGQAAIYRSTLP